MAPVNRLKKVFLGLKQTLEEDQNFAPYLVAVHPFFNQNAYNEVGKLNISMIVGDSDEEIPFTNEATHTDILPTEIILTCDTSFASDEVMYVSEDTETALDLEYELIRSLQSASDWNAATHHQGWSIGGIERDVLVLDQDGNPDFDTRRFVVTLVVDVYLDRTDGPAR